MPSKPFSLLILISCLSLLLFACSNGSTEKVDTEGNSGNGNSESKDDPEPAIEFSDEEVTISIQVHWDEEMFNTRFKEPIEAALPHITVEHVRSGSGREELEELFAQGIVPDILFEVSTENLDYLDLAYNLDEMIEKYGYDTSHINPVFLDAMRGSDSQGRLLGIPYEVIYRVLFYNKDIFDLFGQDYPSNNMTWSEALELGRKMTGERNGVQYRGLDFANPYVPLQQIPVNLTDPETGEVNLDQPEIEKYFDLLDQVIASHGDVDDHFSGARYVEDQTTAMLVEFVQGLNWWQNNESLVQAVAPLPVWDDGPAVSHRPDGQIIPLHINKHSEKKDAAFQVLTFFTESEYQTFASRQGIGPSTIDTSVLSEFFQDYDFADETNVATIFEHPPATPPAKISPWDRYVDLDPGRYATSGMDRNEYLRVIKEESEAKIQEAKATQ